MNHDLAVASSLFASIALRALADLDPTEYRQACDASRSTLDRRIQHDLDNVADTKERTKAAWEHGVRRDGVDWYENGDANTYDNLMQLAVLGEIRYC